MVEKMQIKKFLSEYLMVYLLEDLSFKLITLYSKGFKILIMSGFGSIKQSLKNIQNTEDSKHGN